MNSEHDQFIDPTMFGDDTDIFNTDNMDHLDADTLNLPMLPSDVDFDETLEAGREDAAFLMQLEAVGNFMLTEDHQPQPSSAAEAEEDVEMADASNLPMSYKPSAADLTDMTADLAELDESLGTMPRSMGRGKAGRKRGKLSAEGQRCMGQANELFVNGNYAEAITYLQEAIRLCPSAYEPYSTLGYIYDEEGAGDKAVIFLMVAAHLKQSDADLWRRVAQLSKFVLIHPWCLF